MPRLVLDLIGTVFGFDPLRQRLAAVGAPEHALDQWLAEAERDQLALALAGSWAPLEEVLEASLSRVLSAHPKASRDPSRHALVLKGLNVLNPLEGVGAALEQLAQAGFRLDAVALTSEEVANGLLNRSGLRGHFASVRTGAPPELLRALADGEKIWLGTSRGALLPSARAVGMRTVWISRRERALSAALPAPDLVAQDLPSLAQCLARPATSAVAAEAAGAPAA